MIPNINLLPKTERRRTESNLIYLILGIITVLALAFFVWQYFSARGELADLTAQESAKQAELQQLEAEYQALSTNVVVGSLDESVAFVERVSYDVRPLIVETQSYVVGNTYLRDYSFTEAAVAIKVDFETLSEVAQYVSALENSPYFTDAQLSNVQNFELNLGAAEEQQDDLFNFNDIPRYTADLTLAIDQAYLAAGGDE